MGLNPRPFVDQDFMECNGWVIFDHLWGSKPPTLGSPEVGVKNKKNLLVAGWGESMWWFWGAPFYPFFILFLFSCFTVFQDLKCFWWEGKFYNDARQQKNLLAGRGATPGTTGWTCRSLKILKSTCNPCCWGLERNDFPLSCRLKFFPWFLLQWHCRLLWALRKGACLKQKHIFMMYFVRFFSISRFLKRQKAALCKLLLQEPQCSSKKKKANGLTAGSGAAETSAVWFQPFQKNTQLAWLIWKEHWERLSKAISAELPVKIESWCIGVVKISGYTYLGRDTMSWIYIFQQRIATKKFSWWFNDVFQNMTAW